MAIPLFETCDIAGKDITGDALLAQRSIAIDVVEQHAYDHFCVNGKQPTLAQDIRLLFATRQKPEQENLPSSGSLQSLRQMTP